MKIIGIKMQKSEKPPYLLRPRQYYRPKTERVTPEKLRLVGKAGLFPISWNKILPKMTKSNPIPKNRKNTAGNTGETGDTDETGRTGADGYGAELITRHRDESGGRNGKKTAGKLKYLL